MLISDKYKFVFIAKPKCATNAITSYLRPYSNIIGYPLTKNRKFAQHQKTWELKKNFFNIGERKWNRYFKFITIRNPWAMMISVYFYHKCDKHNIPHWEKGYDKKSEFGIQFNDWIKLNLNENKKLYKPIDHWSGDRSKKKCLVNKIIKVEELNKEMKKICNMLHIPFSGIKKTNTTEHKNYRNYYNEESINIIKKYFKLDIEIGNYSF